MNIVRIIKDACLGVSIVGWPIIVMCIFVSDLVPLFAKMFALLVIAATYGYIFAGDIVKWVMRKFRKTRRKEVGI